MESARCPRKQGLEKVPRTFTTSPFLPLFRERKKPWTISRDSWVRLETVGDVKRLLRYLLIEVEKGRMDRGTARAMAILARVLLRAMEVSDLATRIQQPERIAKRRPGLDS
jgi:hypothetical protein